MTKNDNTKHASFRITKKDNTKQITFRELLIAICAWAVVFIVGLLMCMFVFYALFRLFSSADGTYSFDIGNKIPFLYGLLINIILIYYYRKIKLIKNNIFLHYTKVPLALGIILNILIFLVGASTLLFPSSQSIKKDSCTSLEEQLVVIQNAIVPIATNIGNGTGFAVDDNGLTLTAFHVIDGASEIYASWVTGRIKLTVVEIAPEYDLAILRLDKPTPIFAKLSSNYKLANQLYSFGYPGNAFYAGQASLASGVLSRVIDNESLKLNNESAPNGLELLQTDMAINPGNSGGPIFNSCGVIGIVDSKSDRLGLGKYGITSEEGIGYAISSVTAASRFKLPIDISE